MNAFVQNVKEGSRESAMRRPRLRHLAAASRLIENIPPYTSARAFLDDLRPSSGAWDGDDEAHTGWIFRGQAGGEWRLRPSVFRRPRKDGLLATYLRAYGRRYGRYSAVKWEEWVQPGYDPGSTKDLHWGRRLSRAALDALAHAALVRDFVLIADRAGQPIVRPDFLWHLTNRRLHSWAFERYFRGEVHYDELATFAIAQHHGIPTALLDWTYNPLVAAFFAAEEHAWPREGQSASIAVWAIRTACFRHDFRELRRVTVPTGRVPFLDAQDGLFTWSPIAYEWSLRAGSYPTVEQLVRSIATAPDAAELPRPLLRKLVLPVEEVPALLKLLWREHVTRAHLMPTFDNVTDSMRLYATWNQEAK